jgi:cytochrome c-type biogenesis protein CcmH
MIILLILIVAFLLLMLIIIWRPFFRAINSKKTADNILRDQTNVQLYQEHKNEIEQDFKQGAIDDENYQYLLTELDKSFLQDMAANEKIASKAEKSKQTLSPLWPIFITLFVLVFSITLYQKQGSYLKLTQAPQHTQKNDSEQQALAQIQQIKQALTTTPDDSNLWYSLGQASIGIGDFNGAVKAFDKVIEIEGKKPELLGAKAQAVYYANGQKITPQVQALIDEALALDPLDPSTNVLLGMDNFIQQKYEKAIHYWQILIDSGRDNVNVEALSGAINEAKSRLNNVNNTGLANSPKLTLKVSLSKAFQQKLQNDDDKTIFVYAIPTDGRRMPLAAMKIKLSDLPITITLTNAQAMSPKFNLASAKKVHIYAILSQHGSAGIQPGDYKAELNNVAVSTTEPLDLVINQRVINKNK